MSLVFFEDRCVVCTRVTPRRTDDPVCVRCASALVARSTPPGASLRAAVDLDDRARQVVAALKYRRERRLAGWIANRLLFCVPAGADIVTWAPATPQRRRQRGYDQSAEIARWVGRRLGTPAIETLARDRSDTRQTGRSLDDRATGPALRGTRQVSGLVVVIDDVVTTGATLNHCAAMLERSGADRVVAVAFAATPRRSTGPI